MQKSTKDRRSHAVKKNGIRCLANPGGSARFQRQLSQRKRFSRSDSAEAIQAASQRRGRGDRAKCEAMRLLRCGARSAARDHRGGWALLMTIKVNWTSKRGHRTARTRGAKTLWRCHTCAARGLVRYTIRSSVSILAPQHREQYRLLVCAAELF